MFDLSGRVAIVTGSSRGIGRSAAEVMAKQGAKVVISSRKADALTPIVDGIRKAGGEAIAIPCHVGQVGSMIEQGIIDRVAPAAGLVMTTSGGESTTRAAAELVMLPTKLVTRTE